MVKKRSKIPDKSEIIFKVIPS